MELNNNGTICLPKTNQAMDVYDSHPPEIRQVLQEAPYDLNICILSDDLDSAKLAKALEMRIAEITKVSCLATYGPDHPQSH